jgi:hypothetical protein
MKPGQVVRKQDVVRGAYVLGGAIVAASLLQAEWVHSHEWISMTAVFLLGVMLCVRGMNCYYDSLLLIRLYWYCV